MVDVQQIVKTALLNRAAKNNFAKSQKLWGNNGRTIYAKLSWSGAQVKLYGEVDTGFGLKLHNSRGPVVIWNGRWQFDDGAFEEIDRFVSGVVSDDGVLSIYK